MFKIFDVIKYEGNNDTFIRKHPCKDFNCLTQLIVHENQEAVFYMNGQALDLFGPCRYTLKTQNIPIIGKVLNIATGSFWIGYIFIVLSFVGQLYTSHVILKYENSQKIFYNMSLMSLNCIALVAIFISGLLCMTVPFFPVWLSIILCAFVSGIMNIAKNVISLTSQLMKLKILLLIMPLMMRGIN